MYKVAQMKNGRARGKQKGERRGRDRAEGGAGLRRAAQKKSARGHGTTDVLGRRNERTPAGVLKSEEAN